MFYLQHYENKYFYGYILRINCKYFTDKLNTIWQIVNICRKGTFRRLILGKHQKELSSKKRYNQWKLIRLLDIPYDLSLLTSPLCQNMSKKAPLHLLVDFHQMIFVFHVYFKSCEIKEAPGRKPD